MRHFATGVAVLTTIGPTGPHGMTANAVIPVSPRPPTARAAAHHGTAIHAILQTAASCAVDHPAAHQQALTMLFARSRPDNDPCQQVPWWPSRTTGNPVLSQHSASQPGQSLLSCREPLAELGNLFPKFLHLRAGPSPRCRSSSINEPIAALTVLPKRNQPARGLGQDRCRLSPGTATVRW
ncbi:flavin reductase family protein [Streptomyces sp. NPDC059002]|uniref:flavin reductase family protein n=1 Tax=Streptomyces sp. NPDC059002 TaxID=3346690 RepID=UPI0036BA2381